MPADTPNRRDPTVSNTVDETHNPVETDNVFEIPFRPKRRALDTYSVLNPDGTTTTTAGGGSVISGYTQFHLTAPAYKPTELRTLLRDAESWGPYTLAEHDTGHYLVYDEEEGSQFEVRVQADRITIDVKANTTSESIEQFVTRFESVTQQDWEIDRDSAPLSI